MGSTASGFAAGFTESLVKGIQASRDRKQAEQDRAAQQALSLVNLAIQSGVSPADIPQSVWDAVAPDYAKGAGKKRPPLGQVIGGVLNSVKGSGGQPDTSGAIGGGYFGQGGIEPLWHHGPGTQAPAQGGPGTPIPLSPLPGTATPPGGAGTAGGAAPPAGEAPQQGPSPFPASAASGAPSSGPFGIPFLSPEQQALRGEALKERLRQFQLSRVPATMQALRAIDPTMSITEARRQAEAMVGLPVTSAITGGANLNQSVAGEMPDGTPAFGVFDRETGQYKDPSSGQSLQGFRPRTTSASTSLGTWAERAAGQLGFPNAAAARQAGKMDEVNALAEQLHAQDTAAGTTAKAGAEAKAPLSTKQKFDATIQLQGDWRKAEAPTREMSRQFDLMQTGLKRYEQGDRIGGSQAVLVTFQKILDPSSVVRESEYARSPEGLSIRDRLQGMYDRYVGQYNPETQQWVGGGAGVPAQDLAAMVDTAREFLRNMKTWNDLERDRIEGTAKDYGINPERVFGSEGGGAGAPSTAAPTSFSVTYQGNTYTFPTQRALDVFKQKYGIK